MTPFQKETFLFIVEQAIKSPPMSRLWWVNLLSWLDPERSSPE
jgi:hypothetical protein